MKKESIIYLAIICLTALAIFFQPLLSGQPLGLDTLGHLSKVSYLKLYPSADWDMSWYSGTLFLKMYPPLFYYLDSFFNNISFGANLICFISLILTAIGIYLLLQYQTKNEKLSFLFALSFLSVLSLSYYWIVTGNLPYFSALWTIPFSLYFIEKALKSSRKIDYIAFSLVFSFGILMHVIIGFLIGIMTVVRILLEGASIKNLRRVILFGSVPVLLSAFWFVPFLLYSGSGESFSGYIPNVIHLFGAEGYPAWGLKLGGIGVLAYLFLVLIPFSIKNLKDKISRFYLAALLILGFLLFGGLGSHYPFGVDPVRFILPFSVMLILFSAYNLSCLKISKKGLFLAILLIIIFSGIYWNYKVTARNYEEFSYFKQGSRYQIIQDVLNDSRFPLENKFTNYRFGTRKYVFGETINYFMPNVPHTFGYQDIGMINPSSHLRMQEGIWNSKDINDSFYWLDWFGIRYFEVGSAESPNKFKSSPRFKEIFTGNGGYSFVFFEYLDAKHIISLVDYADDSSFGDEKSFSLERESPDRATIKYSGTDNNDAVLFKEFYHKSWKARELISEKELEVKRIGPGFMAVYPEEGSKGVVFYQTRTIEDWIGIFLTLTGIIILIFVRKNSLE